MGLCGHDFTMPSPPEAFLLVTVRYFEVPQYHGQFRQEYW